MIFLLLTPLNIFWKEFSEMSNIKQYMPMYCFQILFDFYSLEYWIVWCDQHIFWNLIFYIIGTNYYINQNISFIKLYITIFKLAVVECIMCTRCFDANWDKFVYCVILMCFVLHANSNWYYVTCTRRIKFDNFGNLIMINCRNNIDWDESNDMLNVIK